MGGTPLVVLVGVAAVTGAVLGGAMPTVAGRFLASPATGVVPRAPSRDQAAAPPRTARVLLAAASASAFAALTGLVLGVEPLVPAAVPVLLALLVFAAASILLVLIDLAVHRLPDAVVLPGLALAVVLLGSACLLGEPVARLGVAVLSGASLFGLFLLARLAVPAALGGGDVKLAALVGLHAGWFGVDVVLVAILVTFLLGGAFGAVLLLRGVAGRSTAIAFGPWMLAGAWTGILTGGAVVGFAG